MTSFLPKTIHQELRLSLAGFTWLILAEKEHVETDAGGTLILQSPFPLEHGVLVLGLSLLHIEGREGSGLEWRLEGGGEEGRRGGGWWERVCRGSSGTYTIGASGLLLTRPFVFLT
ncbi:hypothetical protein V496_00566 [Pseudogymnoascus sp. VKM F-4515 (FW-2607)]|nr:hypothetical protein V496_00566 [Pseudogymnoascus sp. VKM F-4515 (FW-2607)]